MYSPEAHTKDAEDPYGLSAKQEPPWQPQVSPVLTADKRSVPVSHHTEDSMATNENTESNKTSGSEKDSPSESQDTSQTWKDNSGNNVQQDQIVHNNRDKDQLDL